MNKKKLLICGATGFIGRNMIERFAANDNFEVTGTYFNSTPYNISGVKMAHANLTLKEDVEKVVQGADIIIQAAAVTSGSGDIVTRPHIHTTDNAVMNSLIFRAAHDYQVSRVIFFSCSVMYPAKSAPLKETDFNANEEIHPRYFGVGWTKVYLEKMCEFFSQLDSTRYTVIRHSNIYGPHDKFDLERSHVFGATMTKVLCNNGGKIIVWGDGTEGKDLLYISDLVNFVQLAVEKQDTPFCLCNVGYGSAISVANLIKKIIEVSRKDLRIEYDSSKPSIKTTTALNCAEAMRLFGWKREISLDQGIQKTMSWYQSNINTG